MSKDSIWIMFFLAISNAWFISSYFVNDWRRGVMVLCGLCWVIGAAVGYWS